METHHSKNTSQTLPLTSPFACVNWKKVNYVKIEHKNEIATHKNQNKGIRLRIKEK